MSESDKKRLVRKKRYLISVEETNSVVAMDASIIIYLITLASVFYMLWHTAPSSEHPLHYFTVISNLLSATGAAFMFPYAVSGIRKKRFILPRWLILFQYSGATCVTITLVSSLLLILPTQGITSLEGANFWLHIITPFLTVLLFESVETGYAITFRESLIALIPYWIYMSIYTVMVLIIGEENGGWSDFYKTMAFWPAWISILLMIGIGLGISAILRLVQNMRARLNRKRISKLWAENLDPSEILIEAFGLGRYMGTYTSREEITVPLGIFTMLSKRYNVPEEKLSKAYMKGVIDSLNERAKK